ncbi:hypothetical protein MESS2_790059 [Mesorhizobium metallidurans STM 2683]|uniref:Uncharacterized protein n=1 Tax=Mesorhizobium metallidurans STM 2683 TaxID=1297569 RepID=M5EX44_9HYPH|nr:hypothetical protein MESS2_790059 [Mesorhizobium metallidurans STM 2683]
MRVPCLPWSDDAIGHAIQLVQLVRLNCSQADRQFVRYAPNPAVRALLALSLTGARRSAGIS